MFVGVRPRSDEIWVATAETTGRYGRCDGCQKMVIGLCEMVRRTMWNRFRGDEQADGDVPKGKAAELPPQGPIKPPQGLTIAAKRQVPREFHIIKRTLRSIVTPMIALAVEVGFVVWASSRIQQSAARDSEN